MGVVIFEHFIGRPGKGDVALIWSLRHHAKAFFCDAKERERDTNRGLFQERAGKRGEDSLAVRDRELDAG